MTTMNDFMRLSHALPLAELGSFFPPQGKLPPRPSAKALDQWKMEEDDAPIFKFLYQAHQPRRHLEFGTWQGWGALLCLESCAATVWTMNLPDGEKRPDGTWAYGERVTNASNSEPVPQTPVHPSTRSGRTVWALKRLMFSVRAEPVEAQQGVCRTGSSPHDIVAANYGEDELGAINYHRTDAGGYIGRFYREKGLGHRVCQIYCDSREWDHSNYPEDFFDSVLIDGGHQPEVVVNDTRKALKVLRPGGLIMWHDFCPLPEIRSQFESVKGVTAGIELILPELQPQLERLCWINPSWILVGIKK